MAEAQTCTVEVRKGRMVPKIEYVQSWTWVCNECGWRGVDHFSEGSAIREAQRHVENAHPDLTNPTMSPREADG